MEIGLSCSNLRRLRNSRRFLGFLVLDDICRSTGFPGVGFLHAGFPYPGFLDVGFPHSGFSATLLPQAQVYGKL